MEMPDRTEAARELSEQASQLHRSARHVEQSMGQFADSADRRTQLAGDRTLLAAERTYAAWMRTALAALASGVGATAVVRKVLPNWVGQVTGTILVIFAGFCIVAAMWRELHGITRVSHPDLRPIPKGLLVPVNLFLLVVALVTLVGIWSS
jgi:putative membrane protein